MIPKITNETNPLYLYSIEMPVIWDKYWLYSVIWLDRVLTGDKIRTKLELQCECGRIRNIFSNNISQSNLHSCTCQKHNPEDNIWKKFSKLTIKAIFHKDCATRKQKELWATCECECWETKDIRYDRVISLGTKSCWCIDIRRSTLWLNKERPYKIWYQMKASCYSKNNHMYNRRWEKGIKVQDSWLYFTWWREDNKQYYSDERYFTRIDPFKDFTKENCKRDVCYNVSQFDLFSK